MTRLKTQPGDLLTNGHDGIAVSEDSQTWTTANGAAVSSSDADGVDRGHMAGSRFDGGTPPSDGGTARSHRASDPADATAPQSLIRLASGFYLSRALHVAAKLGLADLLRDGPRSPYQLGEMVQADPDALRRMLRALAGAGVFIEDSRGRFALTPMAELLRSDLPTTLRPLILMWGSDWVWRSWGDLGHSVETGRPAFEHVFGMRTFEYLARHPDDGQIFDAAMASRSRQEDAAVADAYDWPAGTIVDVGGGRGSQLAAILLRSPTSRGVLFDLPHVVPVATRLLGEAGLTARCAVVAGNFFEGAPSGGDLYVLKKVIHDWDDERARIILRHCRSAMSPRARLLLVEHILAPGNEPSWTKLLDLQMLVLAGGRERSEAHYAALLASAGLSSSRVVPTAAGASLIEAVIA